MKAKGIGKRDQNTRIVHRKNKDRAALATSCKIVTCKKETEVSTTTRAFNGDPFILCFYFKTVRRNLVRDYFVVMMLHSINNKE